MRTALKKCSARRRGRAAHGVEEEMNAHGGERVQMRTARKEFEMSKKVTENKEEKQEKVLTKYDLKMQKRAEEKKKAEREERISMITGIVIVVALICLVASFPIRTYLTVNGTYVKVAGEKVSRVEFDYNYNLVKDDYYAQNGYYLSMFGIDLNGDLSTQMYSDTMSWKDFFEQMTIQNIVNNKALRDQAEAAGFTYDASEDYAEYREKLKEAAEAAGVTEKEYIRQSYGTYATASRIKEYIIQGMEINAFSEKISEEKAPSAEEIQAYYEENADSYDSVDYRLTIVNAELPTEPTELADPVEESDSTEGTEGETTDTEEAYQPSEAEIAHAMELAYTEAEEALKSISTEGELRENALKTGVASQLQSWLFSAERKAGDTTIVENTTSNLYYVVEFVNRYRDETPSADARIVIVDADAAVGADAILDEWKAGAATEESFAETADKYNNSDISPEGGLYEGLINDGLPEALADWLYDSARKTGDTAAISGADGEASYVVYYLGAGDPRWSLNIESILLQKTMNAYMDVITEGYEVEDAKGNLNYLKIQAALEAAESAAAESSEEDTDAAESSEESSGSAAE